MRIATCGVLLGIGLLLTGCNDGNDGVVAQDDVFQVSRGGRVDVLANDQVDGVAARGGAGGNVVLTLEQAPSGVWLDATAEGLRIDALAPGSWTVTYRICDAGNSTRCSSAKVLLQVALAELHAVDDDLTLWIDGPSASVLFNDREGGQLHGGIPPGQFTTVEASTALPAGVTLSASGWMAAGAQAVPGTWPVGYRVCVDEASGQRCAAAVARVTVPAQALVSGTVALGAWVGVQSVSMVAEDCDYGGGRPADCGTFALRVNVTAPRTSIIVGRPPRDLLGDPLEMPFVPLGRTLSLAPGRITRATETLSQPVSLAIEDLSAGEANDADTQLRWTPSPAGAPDFLSLTTLSAHLPLSLPGDYTAVVDGVVMPIEVFAAAHLEALVRGSDRASDRPGTLQDAVLRLAASSRQTDLPETATLLRYDYASGRWQERGQASRQVIGGNVHYAGAVDGNGVWAAGRINAGVVVSGCIQDADGVPVSGARVSADGQDHSSSTQTTSDATGGFALLVRRDGRSRIAVQSARGAVASTLDLGPVSSDLRLPDCLRADGASRMTVATSSPLHYYFGSIVTGHEVHAPDGTSIKGYAASEFPRLLVGTYRVFQADVAPWSFDLDFPAVTVSRPGRAGQTVTAPRLFDSRIGAVPAYWLLAEIEVDAACGIQVQRRLVELAAVPVPTPMPAQRCSPG